MSIDSEERSSVWSGSEPWEIPEFRDWRDEKETSQGNQGATTVQEGKNGDCGVQSDTVIQARTGPLLQRFKGDETECLLDIMT